ncbi:hypothetical protein HDV00_003197, partial [Rhizophlyctis rosea]
MTAPSQQYGPTLATQEQDVMDADVVEEDWWGKLVPLGKDSDPFLLSEDKAEYFIGRHPDHVDFCVQGQFISNQ